MIRTFTLYYPADSIIHRLPPSIKFLSSMIYFILLFQSSLFPGYAVLFFLFLVAVLLSKIEWYIIFCALKPILFFAFLTAFFQLFSSEGTPLCQIGVLKITNHGIYQAFLLSSRLLLIFAWTSLLTFTTTPKELTHTIGKLLFPLRFFQIPIQEWTMMMNFGLRFLPMLFLEANKIVAVQTARGADLHQGGLFKRANAIKAICIPVLINVLRNTEAFAAAMESRCYSPHISKSNWETGKPAKK